MLRLMCDSNQSVAKKKLTGGQSKKQCGIICKFTYYNNDILKTDAKMHTQILSQDTLNPTYLCFIDIIKA